MTITVAVVRGPFLNPYDMAPFRQLGTGFLPIGVAARRCLTESDATGLPVRRLICPETQISLRRARSLNRAPSLLGMGYSLIGLSHALRDADIIHSAETNFGFSQQSAKVANRLGVPLVVTVKETIPDVELLHPLRRLGRERVVKREVRAATSLFIAASPAAAAALEQEGVDPGRIEVILPSIDIDLFSAAERQPADHLRLLFCGPLRWRKGIYEAVRAAAVVKRQRPVRLTLCGPRDVDTRPALRLAGELGLSKDVESAGVVPYAAMPAVYARADVLIAPSIPTRAWQEQDSMAVIEAMAAGLPVVATPGGIRTELLGDDGWWTAPGDFVVLAQRILEIAADPAGSRRRVARLRARAREHHDHRVAGQRLTSCYRRVLDMTPAVPG